MLADVRLVIGAKEARLIVRHDDVVVDDEIWTFDRRLGGAEAKDMVQAVFADAYDMVNHIAHGND